MIQFIKKNKYKIIILPAVLLAPIRRCTQMTIRLDRYQKATKMLVERLLHWVHLPNGAKAFR